MQVRELEVFLAVARHLHFGHAAEALHLSQPTVSQSIGRLERELGAPLFVRSTRRVTLTGLGEMFLREARLALEAIETAYERGRDYAAHSTSQFWIGCSVNAGSELLVRMPRLRAACPGVSFNVKEMRTGDQIVALREGVIDAALGWMAEPTPGLSCAVLGAPNPMVAVVAASHPFAAREFLTVDDLRPVPLAVNSREHHPRLYDLVSEWLGQKGKPFQFAAIVPGPIEISMLALSGETVGIAYELVFQNFRLPGLSLVPIVGSPPLQRALMWRSDDRRTTLRALSRVMQAGDHAAASGNSARASA